MILEERWAALPVLARTLIAIPMAGLALLAGYIIGALMLVFLGYVAWRFYD